MAACVFAAQMVNYPIGHGVSGHLLGGTLAAIVLGPCAAVLAMSAVVAVQCLLFGDGGITALGANALNMAVIGTLAGSAVFHALQRRSQGRWVTAVNAMIAAWLSVIVSAAACALELALSGAAPMASFPGAMAQSHALAGVGEALITGAVVVWLAQAEQTLSSDTPPGARRPQVHSLAKGRAGGMRFLALFAVLLAPFAASTPDAFESLAAQFAFAHRASIFFAAPLGPELLGGMPATGLGVFLIAALGSALAFAASWSLFRLVRMRAARR